MPPSAIHLLANADELMFQSRYYVRVQNQEGTAPSLMYLLETGSYLPYAVGEILRLTTSPIVRFKSSLFGVGESVFAVYLLTGRASIQPLFNISIGATAFSAAVTNVSRDGISIASNVTALAYRYTAVDPTTGQVPTYVFVCTFTDGILLVDSELVGDRIDVKVATLFVGGGTDLALPSASNPKSPSSISSASLSGVIQCDALYTLATPSLPATVFFVFATKALSAGDNNAGLFVVSGFSGSDISNAFVYRIFGPDGSQQNACVPSTSQACPSATFPGYDAPTAMAMHHPSATVYLATNSSALVKVTINTVALHKSMARYFAGSLQHDRVSGTGYTDFASITDTLFGQDGIPSLRILDNTLLILDSSNALVRQVHLVDKCPEGYSGPPACDQCAPHFRRSEKDGQCYFGCDIDRDCTGRASRVQHFNFSSAEDYCQCSCFQRHVGEQCGACEFDGQNFTDYCRSCMYVNATYPKCMTPTATGTATSPSVTSSLSNSQSKSLTASDSPLPTSTRTGSSSKTLSLTDTHTSTGSRSVQPTPTPSITSTLTATRSKTPEATPSQTETPIVAVAHLEQPLSATSFRGDSSAEQRTLRIRLSNDRWDQSLDGQLAASALTFRVMQLPKNGTLLSSREFLEQEAGAAAATTVADPNVTIEERGFADHEKWLLENVTIDLSGNSTILSVPFAANSTYVIAHDERIRLDLPLEFAESRRVIRPSYVEFTIVADIEPSSEPVPIPRGVTETAVAVSVTATVVSGGLAGTSTSASLVARSQLVLQMVQCNFDLQEPLDFMQSPSGVKIGTKAPYYAGASVMNIVIGFGFVVLYVAFAAVVQKIKRLPTLISAMSLVYCPSYLYFLLMLFLQSTVVAAVTVLWEEPNPAAIFGAICSLIIMSVIVAHAMFVVLRRFRCEFVPWSKSNFLKSFFMGNGKWIDSTDTGNGVEPSGNYFRMYGVLFQDYKDTYQWFIGIEFGLNIIAGIIEGVHPSPGHCRKFSIAIAFFYTVYLLLLIVFRPHLAPVNVLLVWSISVLQTVAVILIAAAPFDKGATTMATSLSLLSMYVIGVKTIFDILMIFLERACKVVKVYDSTGLSKTFNQESALAEMEMEMTIAELSAREEALLMEDQQRADLDVFADVSQDDIDDFAIFDDVAPTSPTSPPGERRREIGGIEGNYNPLDDDAAPAAGSDPFADDDDELHRMLDEASGSQQPVVAVNALLATSVDPDDVAESPTHPRGASRAKDFNPLKGKVGLGSLKQRFSPSDSPVAEEEGEADDTSALLGSAALPARRTAPNKLGSSGSLPAAQSPPPPPSAATIKPALDDELEALLRGVEEEEEKQAKKQKKKKKKKHAAAEPDTTTTGPSSGHTSINLDMLDQLDHPSARRANPMKKGGFNLADL